MKNLKMKALEFGATTLTRNEMKNVIGGWGPVQICFRCCPDDPCSPKRFNCTAAICPN